MWSEHQFAIIYILNVIFFFEYNISFTNLNINIGGNNEFEIHVNACKFKKHYFNCPGSVKYFKYRWIIKYDPCSNLHDNKIEQSHDNN